MGLKKACRDSHLRVIQARDQKGFINTPPTDVSLPHKTKHVLLS